MDDIDIQNASCPICDLSQRWLDLSKKVSKIVSVKANLVENLGNSVAGEHPTEELKKF